MAKKSCFMGLDLGTTGIKMIILREDGVLIDQDYSSYPILSPRNGYAEQDPDKWWHGLCKISNNLIRRNENVIKSIEGLGITGQMHTHVYLDSTGEPLGNAITWLDQRSENIVKEYRENYEDIIIKNTLNFITTTYSAPQIVWTKRNKKDLFSKTDKILLAKDYIKFKLTGEMITDYSDAAGTLLFNIKDKKWSEEMLSLFDIDKKLLPSIDKSMTLIGRVTPEAAKETGLPEGIPVINGSADHAAASLGAGVIAPGQASMVVGTAGVMSLLTDEPIVDKDQRIVCWNYCLDDKWVLLGVTQTAGQSLEWFKKAFDSEEKNDLYQIYNDEASRIEPGCEGLIFLPYLMGERSPYWDPKARGVFFGITLNHNKYHFVRAIMEGVSFAFKNIMDVMESLGFEIEEIRILGGGSKSEVWKAIISQVTNKKLMSISVEEAGALGTTIMTQVALGLYDSVEAAVSDLVLIGQELDVTKNLEVYDNHYEIFKDLYKINKNLFTKLKES